MVPASDDVMWAVLDSGLPADLQVRLLPIGRPQGLPALDSERGMAAALARAGFRQPEWRWTEKAGEVAALARELGSPVVVKQGRSRAGGGVQFLRALDEPLRLTAATRTRGLLAERWIPGGLWSVETVYRRGLLTLLATSEVLCSLGETGVSVSRRYEDLVDGELLEGLSNLGRDLALDGFGNISAIRDADGRL